MVAPFDYTRGLPQAEPGQSFAQGFQMGNLIQQNQLRAQQLQQAQAQAEAQAQAQAAQQAYLQDLSNNPTPDRIGQAILRYPQLSEHFQRAVNIIEPAKLAVNLKETIPVYAAAINGRTDIAERLVREKAAALEAAGDKNGAEEMSVYADSFRDSPGGATLNAGLMIAHAMGPKEFLNAFPALAKAPSEATIKGAEAAVAEETQALNLKKLNAEIDKLGSEEGGFSREKTFDIEAKLRAEYARRVDKYIQRRDVYSQIKAISENISAKNPDAAPGLYDHSLILSYFKMLDPTSVVSGPEGETIRKTTSISDDLWKLYQKTVTGSLLTPGQRTTILGLAKKLNQESTTKESEIRGGFSNLAKNYGVDPSRLFIEQIEEFQLPDGWSEERKQ